MTEQRTQICTNCGIEKSLDQFWRRRGKPIAQCMVCRGAAYAKWRKNNLEKRRDDVRRSRQKRAAEKAHGLS